MSTTGVKIIFMTLCVNALFTNYVSGSFPKAHNVTWSSINFKTILLWNPKPTDYSYTVEFSVIGQNRERNPHCIRTTETECDLSNSLTKLKDTYSADVLSEPSKGVSSDLIEFPHTSSERFCPYKDTEIGRPDFKIDVSKDKRKITLYVTDPLTALFEDLRQLSVRDIFADQLQYKVTYRRAKSTGKKVYISKSSEIELTDVDMGESYCFNVQAYLPTRTVDKQLGTLSQTQCSHEDSQSIFEVFSVGVIAGFIFIILAIVASIIAVIVVCCKRRSRANKSGKEGVPLRVV